MPTEPLDLSTVSWHYRKRLVEPANTSRAPQPQVYRARELLPAHEPSETDNHWQEAAPATYTLKLYLQESWFPAFKVGPRVQQAFVWPHYPELQAQPGTRKLRAISRIAPKHIRGAACDCALRDSVLFDMFTQD